MVFSLCRECGINLGEMLLAILSMFYIVIEPCAGIMWTLAVGIPILWSAKSFSAVLLPFCLLLLMQGFPVMSIEFLGLVAG